MFCPVLMGIDVKFSNRFNRIIHHIIKYGLEINFKEKSDNREC